MKRISALLLCLLLALSFTACGKKDKAPDNAPISGIEPAAADKIEEKTEEAPEPDTSDRTPETDRKEIENNLRDAQELINDGNFDDATMIINSLKTRDLTESEKEKIKDLQKQMIKVSD